MIRRTLSLLLFLSLPGATFAATIPTVEVGWIRLAVDGALKSASIDQPEEDPGSVIATAFWAFAETSPLRLSALAASTVEVKVDPYLASATRIQSTSTSAIFLSLDISSLMEPFLPGEGTGSLERFLRFTLTDANQNGAASFGPANIFFSVQERSSGMGAQAGGFLTATLAAPGVLTRLDGTEAPLNVFLPSSVQQFDGLRFQLSGTLSAGDELLVEVFSCFRKGAQTCPPRPLLEAPAVPVPGAAVLLVTALGGLVPWLRRGRA